MFVKKNQSLCNQFQFFIHLIEETLTREKHKPWTMRLILGKGSIGKLTNIPFKI